MNIMHLKYAVEIAKTGSLNRAAENLYMGQPNLSRAIKELEADLGIRIFSRSAKGMVATTDGEEFLKYAEKILGQIDEVEAIFKQGIQKKRQFSVSVPRASYIAEAFANFTALVKDEEFEFFYKETNTGRVMKNILQSDYSLGIIRYASDYDKLFKDTLEEKGLCYELVTEFSYNLLMSCEHPLAHKEEISLSDLAPYTEIAHADPFVPSMPAATVRKEEIPINVKKRINVFERGSQFELLENTPGSFMWVSPVPNTLMERYHLIQRPCVDNKRVYKDMLIYKKDYRLNDLDKMFITELCLAKRKYIPTP